MALLARSGRPLHPALKEVRRPFARLCDPQEMHELDDRKERSLQACQISIRVRGGEVLWKYLREPEDGERRPQEIEDAEGKSVCHADAGSGYDDLGSVRQQGGGRDDERDE